MIVCWESGFNGTGLWMGPKVITNLTEPEVCNGRMVPVRVGYSTGCLDQETLELVKYNVF